MINKNYFLPKLRNISDDITVCMLLNQQVFHFLSGNIGLDLELEPEQEPK